MQLPWEAGLADLQAQRAPSWMSAAAWDDIVYRAMQVSRDWGQQASDRGWSDLDLFGCHPDPRCMDHSRDGLVMLLAGWAGPITIKGISADIAELEAIHSSRLRYRRGGRAGAVLIWHAFASESGP